jgi:hypothetical protein
MTKVSSERPRGGGADCQEAVMAGLGRSGSVRVIGAVFDFLDSSGCDLMRDDGMHSEFLSFAVNFTALRMN